MELFNNFAKQKKWTSEESENTQDLFANKLFQNKLMSKMRKVVLLGNLSNLVANS